MSDHIQRELAELELNAPVAEPPAGPPPITPTPRPTAPEADEPTRPSGRARLLLGLSVTGMTLLWLAPLALLVWLGALALAPGAAAELLQAADGLRPTTFGGAVWLAAGAVTLVLGAAAWRAIQRLRNPERAPGVLGRPGLTLTLGASIAVVGAVTWESRGVDLPDTAVGGAILVALFGAVAVLPVQLARLVGRLARRAWRSRRAPPWTNGLWTGLALGWTLAGSVGLLAILPDDEGTALSARLAVQLELVGGTLLDAAEEAAGEQGLEAAHDVFETTSERLHVSATTGFGAPAQALFDRCIEDLMSPAEGRSRLDEAILRLQRRGTRPGTAEDVAQFAVLITCEKYALGRVTRGIHAYFNAVVAKAAAYEFRRWDARGCRLEAIPEPYANPSPEVALQLQAVIDAMCRLDPADQSVLDLAAQGLSAPEIAEHLGITPAAARKRLSRARQRLRAALEDR